MHALQYWNYFILLLCMLPLSCTSTGRGLHVLDNVSTSDALLDESVIDPRAVAGVELTDNSLLEDYLLYAFHHSPRLRSSYLTYQAEAEKEIQVSSLPEPRISYSYFLESLQTRVGPAQHTIGVMQQFPWFGTLSLKEKAAGLNTKAALYSFLAQKNKLILDLVSTYLELEYLSRARESTESTLSLVTQWEDVLMQRYRVNTGSRGDLVNVQVEKEVLRNKLSELREYSEPLSAKFFALLGVRKGAGKTQLLVVHKGTPVEFLPRTLVSEISIEENPELLLMQATVQAKKVKVKLADALWYPQVGLGVNYTVIGSGGGSESGTGEDAVAPAISFQIPLNFSSYRAAKREATLKVQAAESALEAHRFSLEVRYAEALFQYRDSQRRIALYEDSLIPKAKELFAVALQSFEAGDLSFQDLLMTQKQLLDFDLNKSRAQIDFRKAQAELAALSGGGIMEKKE